jgi:CheY-like chemotaxis protein
MQPELRRVHLVAMTGYGQEADRQRTREAGFVAHLVKPVDFDDLSHALAELG